MRFGFLLFPGVTQLDLTGPWEVLARVPQAETVLIWKTLDPVATDGGLRLSPTATVAGCPDLDLLLVPGGGGVDDLLADAEVLAFLRAKAAHVRWLVSVCTGALALGAAGLLRGRRATTHWSALSFLPPFGATVAEGRVVEDGNLFSCGGVTAGIDVALTVVARAFGEELAKAIQLQLEYDPKPPFDGGTPGRADPDTVLAVERRMAERRKRRAVLVSAAAERMEITIPEFP